MSDRQESSPGNDQPLFQNMDEQERVFAPEQVPGALPSDTTDDPDPATIPSTVVTTPELTYAAPATIAESREAEDAENSGNQA